MLAGRLDRLVQLQHQNKSRNATTGEEEVTGYTTYATVWAAKRDVRGREVFAAQQVNSDITTFWQIRYRNDVLATDRLLIDGLSYNILPPAEIGRKVGLELQATAVRA